MSKVFRLLSLILVLLLAGPSFAQSQVCDVDIDGDIDSGDLGLILRARNTPASGPDDPRDADGDGFITLLDVRACSLQCTLPDCSEPQLNQPPNIVSTPVTTATVGELYTYDVDAVDPDGDTLTYSLDTAPAGMTIDPTSGLIQWTPATGQAGAAPVAVRATDPGNLFASQAFVIDTVAAGDDFLRPEVTLTVTPGVNTNVNEILTLQVTATDDTAVTATALTIDGANVPLDPAGVATFTSAVPGIFDVLATATDTSGNEGAATATLRFLETGDATPPTASITSPANDASITSPVQVIGTATDETALLQYRLQAARAGTNDFFLVGSGNVPVVNGVLGQLDPSLLQNGTYDLQLVVEDTAGNTVTAQTIVQVEGDLKVGNFSLTITDLEIPVSGIPIAINRNYDSRRKTSGDFGFGWLLELDDIRVDENGLLGDGWQQTVSGGFFPTYSLVPTRDHTITVTYPDGSSDSFDMSVTPNSQQIIPFSQTTPVNAQFPAGPGTASTLVPLDGTQIFPSGGVGPITFLDDIIGDTYDPDRYRITRQDGTQFDVSQISGIERITDRNGNVVTFGPGGIIHSAGTNVQFTRDAQNRITAITDPLGNVLTYEYDAYGDLVATTDAEGNTTRYRYNSSHGLIEIIDPLGRGVARNEYDDDGRLTATVDANGNRIEFARDLSARQEIVTDRNGNVTVFGYDDRGNVTAETDALGNTTTFTYDADGNQTSRTDALGNTSTRTFDANDNPLSETDPLGNTSTFTYNAAGDPLTTTDPSGNTYSRSYDAAGNLLTETDALGEVTTHTYDAAGNVLTTTDANGNVTSFTYDARGNETSITDPLGNVTTFTYDANGNQLTETRTRTLPGGGTQALVTSREYDGLNRIVRVIDPLGGQRQTVYDANSKIVAEFDALGRATSYDYDARGNLTRTTFPDGTSETFVYDPENRLVESVDRLGRATTLEYDALGRQTRVTAPDGTSTAEGYDAAGRRTNSTDQRGNETRYEYDAAGRHVRTIDALGNETTFQYDAVGNQTAITDPLGRTTQFVYDANDRLVRTTFPDGTTAIVDYDALGRRVAETDQLGQTTSFQYDAAGRLTGVTDALGNATTFTYDEVGNKLTQTDANGNTESWTYDGLGRVLTHTLPLGQTESFTYDAVGNVLTHEDFNGNTTTHEYDVNDRLVVKTFADLSTETYTYTDTGLIATVDDARGTTTFTYDDRDRLVEKTLTDGQTLEYTYDASGNRSSLTTTAGTTGFTWDALNRLATVTDTAAGVTTYAYDAAGNRAALTYPNGNETTYTYNALNRLTRLVNEDAAGTVLSSYDYTLAADGKRTRVVEADGRQVDYLYDAVNRLIREVITEPGPVVTTYDYAYDAVGNRLTRMVNAATMTAYTYDANDRLLSEDISTYAYDANGNLVRRTSGTAVTDYSYDFENQLVAVDTALDSVDYEYDELGNRVSRTVNGTRTDFLVDTNNDLSRVVAELDAGGTPLVDYTVGDDLVSQRRAGVDSFYLFDGNGNVRQLSGAGGAVTDAYDYDAFGNLLGGTGSTTNEFRFAGEQLDANVGFYYLRARWMDPAVGRFVSRDPVVGNTFDPPSLHKYSYAKNDPVNVADPTGQFGISSIGFSFSVRSILISAAISAPFRALEAAKDLSEGASLGAVTLSLVGNVAFDVAVGGAIGNLFSFARSLVKIRAASQSVAAFRNARNSKSVWNLSNFDRGWEIEKKILGSRNLVDNFPTIDAWNKSRGVATSLKSLDLTATSYQTASGLRSAVLRRARELANFQGARRGTGENIVNINPADIKKRVLVYALEPGAATRTQARALRELATELKRDLKIDLVFQWIP